MDSTLEANANSQSPSGAPPLTELLRRFSEGDKELAEIILREILPKLHQIAVREVSRERVIAPLTPTELINEVWLRNLHKGRWTIQNRSHFYAIAAHAMRCVLVDMARRRLASTRGGGANHLSLDEQMDSVATGSISPDDIIEIDRLMLELDRKDPAIARIIEMHYFSGFSMEEIAEATGLTARQVRHLWDKGRSWLYKRLNQSRPPRTKRP